MEKQSIGQMLEEFEYVASGTATDIDSMKCPQILQFALDMAYRFSICRSYITVF
jgi:hypothetical protein